MLHTISKRELMQAQVALLVAIGLQFIVWQANHGYTKSQLFIIGIELAMMIIIAFGASMKTLHNRSIHRVAAFILLALISAANISSLILVLESLVTGNTSIEGMQLLASAFAIFLTNIIVFALWYWEIDSPGLTRSRWSKNEKDFQFTQQDNAEEFKDWKPQFLDYLFVSVINAFNGAATSANPLTHQAKALMALQAMVSVFTLVIVIARSVSILGT